MDTIERFTFHGNIEVTNRGYALIHNLSVKTDDVRLQIQEIFLVSIRLILQ